MSGFDDWLAAQEAGRWEVDPYEVEYQVERANHNSYDLNVTYEIQGIDLLFTVEDAKGKVNEFENLDDMTLWFYELDDAEPDDAEAMVLESRAEYEPVPRD